MSLTRANDQLRVLVIVASTRPGRLAPAVASWFVRSVEAQAEREDAALDVADLAEIGLPLLDEPEHPSSGTYVHEHTRAWSRLVDAADAFVIVTPEYNYGMPAVLKNALDYLYQEWAWKPVGFVSYGNTSAGTRSVQMTKQVVTTLRLMPIGATVALRIADSTRDGQVLDSPERQETAVGVLHELCRVAREWRPLRFDDAVETEYCASVRGLTLAPAQPRDLPELLVLQRCCWVQEALANDTLDLQPLRETLDELAASTSTWQRWCVRRHGRLVASVRARADGATWQIGRLMVAPDQTRHGIGSWLLSYVEGQAPEGTVHCALFTGDRSSRNIALYQRAGYALTRAADVPDGAVYLTKPYRLCA
jgi:NAD(P)H-dependent FMN reductase/GNAT superfamily N-acetyltransferase